MVMAAHENMSYRAQDISYRFFNLIVELVDLENLHVDTFFHDHRTENDEVMPYLALSGNGHL